MVSVIYRFLLIIFLKNNVCNSFPQYKIAVNYLRIAQASQFCQAHFKAILYGDLWYREEEEQGKHDAKRHPELLNIMKSCHLAVGVNDAVKSFLNPIQERMEYYRLEQNYARCLAAFSCCWASFALASCCAGAHCAILCCSFS